MPEERLLTEVQALQKLALSRSALWRLQKTEPELRPVYPSVGAKRYLNSEVEGYIKRISERRY
jgi:predicted DNA-binding transcriptional regulator AlpA